MPSVEKALGFRGKIKEIDLPWYKIFIRAILLWGFRNLIKVVHLCMSAFILTFYENIEIPDP
jgi:hypothetical protein